MVHGLEKIHWVRQGLATFCRIAGHPVPLHPNNAHLSFCMRSFEPLGPNIRGKTIGKLLACQHDRNAKMFIIAMMKMPWLVMARILKGSKRQFPRSGEDVILYIVPGSFAPITEFVHMK